MYPSKSLKSQQAEEFRKKLTEASIRRGTIIEAALIIEGRLNQLFSQYFCKDTLSGEFEEKILNREFFTFENKIRLLNRLSIYPIITSCFRHEGKKNPTINFHNINQLKKGLAFIREIRNALAHSPIHTDNLTPNSTIKYTYDKKRKEIELTSDFVADYTQKAAEITEILIMTTLRLRQKTKSFNPSS
jgi:hypothetical protein